MTRINTNVASLLGQRILSQNNQALTKSLERLSTGLRINRGADDPAGLIASQNLRAEKSARQPALLNAVSRPSELRSRMRATTPLPAIGPTTKPPTAKPATTTGFTNGERKW